MKSEFQLYDEAKLNLTTIYGILKDIPSCKQVKYAFFSTYDGMDFRTLEQILLALPGGNQLITNGEYDVFCGSKGLLKGTDQCYLSEILMERLHRVTVKGAFHPKIYCVKYGEGTAENDEIMLIISSKNITENAFLDAFVCMKGVKRKGQDNNGKQLSALLLDETFGIFDPEIDKEGSFAEFCENELPLYCFSLWGNERENETKTNISFLRPNPELLDSIFTMGTEEKYPLIAVSPFVSEGIIRPNSFVRLYSSREELDAKMHQLDSSELQRVQIFYSDFAVIRKAEEDSSKYPSSLHAKVYAGFQGNKSIIYIGSANFTKAAFSLNNSEILVKIESEGEEAYKKIKDGLENSGYFWREWEKNEKNPENTKPSQVVPEIVYKELGKIKAKWMKNGWCYSLQLEEEEIGLDKETTFQIINENESYSLKILKLFPLKGFTRNAGISFKAEWQGNSVNGEYCLDILEMIDEDDVDMLGKRLQEKKKKDLEQRKEFLMKTGRTVKHEKTKDDKNNIDHKKERPEYRSRTAEGLFEIIRKIILTEKNDNIVEKIREYKADIEKKMVGLEWSEEERIIFDAILCGSVTGSGTR